MLRGFWWENPKGKRRLEGCILDGGIILKCILMVYDGSHLPQHGKQVGGACKHALNFSVFWIITRRVAGCVVFMELHAGSMFISVYLITVSVI
jgi:hypothetical protein